MLGPRTREQATVTLLREPILKLVHSPRLTEFQDKREVRHFLV